MFNKYLGMAVCELQNSIYLINDQTSYALAITNVYYEQPAGQYINLSS